MDLEYEALVINLLLHWFYFFVSLKLFLIFLLLVGLIDIFLEMISLSFLAIWYYLEAVFRWFVPRRRKNISGLTAVVTGAGHGIGKHIATGLARKGVKVVLWDINKQSVDAVAAEIKDQNGEAFAYKCDVSKKEEVYEAALKVKGEVGDVDILVNNAGVVSGQKLLHCSDDDIIRTMDVNVMAHFWTTKAFLGSMKARNRGNVVAIASIMGLVGTSCLVDYCTSKSAIIGMMDALRQEVISDDNDGISLTTILPSKVDTGMFGGVQGRFRLFPPTIQPEYVARKVIDAIQRNEVYVVLPHWLSPVFPLKRFMPQRLIDAAMHFFGLWDAMEEFTGHKKKPE